MSRILCHTIFNYLLRTTTITFKNIYVFITIIFLISLFFFSNDYVWSKLPGNLWDLSDTPQTIESLDEDISKQSVKTIEVKKGDTFIGILNKQKISRADIQKILAAAKKTKIGTKLKIGEKITFYYNIELLEQSESELVEEKFVLERISIQKDKINSTELLKQENSFVTKFITKPIKKVLSQYEATIETNIISSLQKAGLNNNSAIQLINAYSYQIDLQRQIRKGDTIKVIVEKFLTEEGDLSHHGRVLYASLTSKGKKYNIYSYAIDNKNHRFFDEKGKSIKGTLLRTPLDVVRISSHFGYRKKHPVHGYGRMHKGVDFAASTGTPIYSAGDGIVEFIGWKNGYGRFLLIKHNSTLSTAYAHASKFAKNIKKGSKVKQGQVIAYVGSTGHATGPHLHYEVRINGKQVNPMKFKSTPGIKLANKNLDKFLKLKLNIAQISKKLTKENYVEAKQFKI